MLTAVCPVWNAYGSGWKAAIRSASKGFCCNAGSRGATGPNHSSGQFAAAGGRELWHRRRRSGGRLRRSNEGASSAGAPKSLLELRVRPLGSEMDRGMNCPGRPGPPGRGRRPDLARRRGHAARARRACVRVALPSPRPTTCSRPRPSTWRCSTSASAPAAATPWRCRSSSRACRSSSPAATTPGSSCPGPEERPDRGGGPTRPRRCGPRSPPSLD